VNSGKSLFRIINIDELFVEADIFESDMRAIDDAKTARVYVEGYPDKEFRGTLHSISPEIDPLRRTAKVLFAVDNKEGLLRGGMFARLEIEIGAPEPTLVVPKNAIVSGDSLKQVYRKIAPELFEAVPVSVERFLDIHAVVRSPDLKPDDVIVTQGQYQVRMAPVVGVAE
jgi:Cu(I)/Ag(I) efflux system membrane fusion protein